MATNLQSIGLSKYGTNLFLFFWVIIYFFYLFQPWTNYITATMIQDSVILCICHFAAWRMLHIFPCEQAGRAHQNLELSVLQTFHYASFHFYYQTFIWKLVFPMEFWFEDRDLFIFIIPKFSIMHLTKGQWLWNGWIDDLGGIQKIKITTLDEPMNM